MPTTDELQQQINALTQRVNAITAPPTDYYVHQYSGEEIDNAVAKISGSTGLVSSFNGRTGAVMPAAGDYTAAMVGAAPSGFGLGTGFANAPGLDANQIAANGVYAANNNVPVSGVIFIVEAVVGANSQNQIQYAYAYRPSSGVPTASTIQRRIRDSGLWSAWEWINPPMSIGVEYRTVERYLGKPVYIKLVNCGTFAAPGTVKTVTFDDTGTLSRLVDFGGEVSEGNSVWAIPTFLFGVSYEDSSIIQAEPRIMSGNGIIYLYTKTRDLTSNTSYVWVKYTKKTD